MSITFFVSNELLLNKSELSNLFEFFFVFQFLTDIGKEQMQRCVNAAVRREAASTLVGGRAWRSKVTKRRF